MSTLMNIQELKAKLLARNTSEYWHKRTEYINLQVTAARYAYGIGVDEWSLRKQAAEKYEKVPKP